MAYDMVGKLHKKFDTESKTSSFQAREFVMETADTNYTQYIKFQLTQDRCSIIDNYNEGDQLKVHFDLRGREWNEKYFTNLNAWKVESMGAGAGAPPAASAPAETSFPAEPANLDSGSSAQGQMEDFDDLPF